MLELAGLEELRGGQSDLNEHPRAGDPVVQAEGIDGGDLEEPPDSGRAAPRPVGDVPRNRAPGAEEDSDRDA